MRGTIEWLFDLLAAVPVETLYVLVGLGAAVENVFPPVPSDTFVVLGGVLAERGSLDAGIVLAVAWTSNILLGCVVYLLGVRYGRSLFGTRWGRWLLRPHQLQRMSTFYGKYGTITVLVSRFFPVFRVLVPAFAGISRLGFWRTVVPMGVASAAWYGALVWAGMFASRNVPRLISWLDRVNIGLLAGALVVAGLVGFWWWRTRRAESGTEGDPAG